MMAALMRRLMSFDTRVTRASGNSLLQRQRVGEDVIVGADGRASVSGRPESSWRVWKNRRPLHGFLPWLPALGRRQLQAVVDLLLGGRVHQLIEEAAHLAHVARRLRQALLARVELLEHDHRDVDVVFLEAEDRRRIVHQHVGVEHEDAALAPRAAGFQIVILPSLSAVVTTPARPAAPARHGRPPSPCAIPGATCPRHRSGRCCARRP